MKQDFTGWRDRWQCVRHGIANTQPAHPGVNVPPNYDSELVAIRRRLQCTQASLASAIGAANRHVVYQWESRRRTPSPEFWRRIMSLASLPHLVI